jgi:hypothetical protein
MIKIIANLSYSRYYYHYYSSRVDVEDEKECHKAFEKAMALRTPMPSESCAMVVFMGANQCWLYIHGFANYQHG